jgi:hypothetical protein
VEIKEWLFKPFVPLLPPYNKYGLFIRVEPTKEIHRNFIADKENKEKALK